MRCRFVIVILACAACGPSRPAASGAPIRSEEVVLSIEREPPPPPIPPPGQPRDERYGYSFEDDDPLAAGAAPLRQPPGNVDPSHVPAAPQWKCAPGSTCEVRDALELHKDLFAPCRAAARLPDPAAAVRFVAHATLDRNGAVTSIAVRDLAPRSRAVEACVARAFRQIPFPLQVDVDQVELTVPVRLVRAPGEPAR